MYFRLQASDILRGDWTNPSYEEMYIFEICGVVIIVTTTMAGSALSGWVIVVLLQGTTRTNLSLVIVA